MAFDELGRTLDLLEERDLIRSSAADGGLTARFKHSLTRDATYAALLYTRRAEIHRLVALTLTRLHPQRDLDMTLTLAEHWIRGGAHDRALDELLARRENLAQTGRGPSLIALLGQLPDDHLSVEQQARRDLGRGDAYAARSEYEQARRLYAQALAQPVSGHLRAILNHQLGAAYTHLGQNAQALDAHQAALEWAAREGDLALQAQANSGIGLAYWNLGDYIQAAAYLEQSRALGEQLGASMELANANLNLALLQQTRGDYQATVASASRALALYEQLGLVLLAARAAQALGGSYYLLGDRKKAAEYYERGIASSRELGDRLGLVQGLYNLAELAQDSYELDWAEAYYREALAELRSFDGGPALPFVLTDLAQVLAARVRKGGAGADALGEAEQYAREALALARSIQSPEREAAALRVLAEIMAVRGEQVAARDYARQAVDRLESGGSVLERQRAYRTYGELLAKSPDAAERVLGAQMLSKANQEPLTKRLD